MGILDGRLFPSLSTEFLGKCCIFSVAIPEHNFPLLLLFSQVILIGILDFCSPAGRRFLLPSSAISPLTNRGAIGVRQKFHDDLEQNTVDGFVFLLATRIWSVLLNFFFETHFVNLKNFPAPKIGSERTKS